MIAKKVYSVFVKIKSFDFGENRTHIKSSVTSQRKHFFYKCLKNTHTVSVLYSLHGVKDTHADIRMLKYECLVNGNIKQTSNSQKFIRIGVGRFCLLFFKF